MTTFKKDRLSIELRRAFANSRRVHYLASHGVLSLGSTYILFDRLCRLTTHRVSVSSVSYHLIDKDRENLDNTLIFSSHLRYVLDSELYGLR